MNILLSCVGRRNYLVEFFAEALAGEGKVVGTDRDPTAPALAACDVRRLVPSVDDPSYLERLKAVMIEEEISMAFSLSDLEVSLLARSRDAIEAETKAVVYVPSERTATVCSDKWETYRFARRHGIAAPVTFLSPSDALQAARTGEVAFPMIVKPRWGSASIGLVRVESPADLEAAVELCEKAIARSSLASLGLGQSVVIIQELLTGPEYGVDVLYGRDENFVGFAAKRKLAMRSGETDKAVTVAPDPFEASVRRIAQNLPHRGNLDCDFMERGGELLLLELNPRFGGGYPFTHLSGARHVAMLLDDFSGRSLPPYHYDVGRSFAKYDHLIETPVPQL
jgi:carbamoyl-phosphate synthase large subunit